MMLQWYELILYMHLDKVFSNTLAYVKIFAFVTGLCFQGEPATCPSMHFCLLILLSLKH